MEFRLLSCIVLVCLFRDIKSETLEHLKYRMRNIKTIDEFLDSMVRDQDGNKIDLVREEHQFTESGEGVLASGEAVPLAGMDFCSLRNMTYMFPKAEDANIMYFPECMVVEQCGGCCNGDLVSCQPARSETEYVKVLAVRYNYDGASNFEYVAFKKFAVERHLSCNAACTVQASDCHPNKHVYIPDLCACECKTSYIRPCPLHKRFDNSVCDCVCKEIKTCGTQSAFNENTCECESGLFASGAGGQARTTVPPATTTEECASLTCPTDWIAMPLESGSGCNCFPARRMILGKK